MKIVLRDFVSGLRMFMRRPGFAFLSAGTLALGIGAHAALFSVIDGVLLDPVALPEPDELVVVHMQVDGEERTLTGPNVADLVRETEDVFASAAGFFGTTVTIENPDGTRESRDAVGATAGVFDALGVPVQLGRAWGAESVGRGSVSAIVITDRYWRSRFGADSSIVGTALSMSGLPVEVTGVLAPQYEFPTQETADLIFASPVDLTTVSRAGLGAFTVLARLRPDVSVDRASEEIQAVWEALRTQHPGDLLDHGITLWGLRDYMVRDVRPTLMGLLGATTLLLLLACANVSNLVLARGVARGQEMSVRTSLGAGRGRLFAQLLTENLVLAGVAGMGGLLLAHASLALVRSFGPTEITGLADVRLSLSAAGFGMAAAMGCALIAGMLPAARVSRSDLAGTLRTGSRATLGRGLRRLQDSLVVAQVASAVVLSIGTGLLAWSFATLSAVDPGYRTEGVLTAGVVAPLDLYTDRPSRVDFFRRLEREVMAIPGVTQVGTTFRPPFSTGEMSVPVRLADDEAMTLEGAPRVELNIISAGYLGTLEIPVLRGRGFTDRDTGDSPRVALLSASLARTLYGDEGPVGRRLTPVIGASWDDATDWAEVVGIVGDVRLQSLDAAVAGTLYLASEQLAQPYGALMARTSQDPSTLVDAVRNAAMRVEPKLIEPTVESLADLRSESLAGPRFNAVLLAVFSVLALTLSTVGIYGLLSFSVASRRLELGVRTAFGADRASLVRLVLAQGMILVVIGIVIGGAGALAARGAISGLLFGVTATEPAVYAGTVIGVTLVALAGCVLPALRAARGATIEALRAEGA